MRAPLKLVAAATGLLFVGTAAVSQAAPVVIDDSAASGYWGGNINGADSEVFGNPAHFAITSASVERLGNNLSVIIATNYSGKNVGTLNTNLGALFFGDPKLLNLAGGVTPSYKEDTFEADKDRFGYVFDFDAKPKTTQNYTTSDQGGTGTLYKLKGDGSDIVYSNPAGNTVRNDQAVDIKDKAKGKDFAQTGITGNWSTKDGSVTFLITNFFGGALPGLYNTSLTLAWAMTCANDIILGEVVFPLDGPVGTVPLPAGLLLMVSGLAGLGFLRRFKGKASKTTA